MTDVRTAAIKRDLSTSAGAVMAVKLPTMLVPSECKMPFTHWLQRFPP